MATVDSVVNICVGIAAFESFVLFIRLLVLLFTSKSANTPKKEVLALAQQPNHLLTAVASFKTEMMRVVKLIPRDTFGNQKRENDQKEIDEFLGFLQADADAIAQGKVETIAGARDGGKLPILKQTRVSIGRQTNLHVNKLHDLYGNPIYLAAAPLPAQFADHWELIWREKIGVVVWAGRLSGPDDEARMHAYINTQQGKQADYGNFQVKTVKAVDRRMKSAVYLVGVQFQGRTRQVVVIHAYEWRQESVPWALRREVEAILELKEHHIDQIRNGLPGLLMQCKWGTAGSASMTACYIGFQTWLRCRKVNLFAIIQYIRGCRWKAFEATGSNYQPPVVQLQVAHVVAYAVTKFIEEQKLPLFEEDLKQALLERRSIALPAM